MKIDLNTMQPRHDFNRLMLNAKSLTINGHCGLAELTDDGRGNVTLTTSAVSVALRMDEKLASEPSTISVANYAGPPMVFDDQAKYTASVKKRVDAGVRATAPKKKRGRK